MDAQTKSGLSTGTTKLNNSMTKSIYDHFINIKSGHNLPDGSGPSEQDKLFAKAFPDKLPAAEDRNKFFYELYVNKEFFLCNMLSSFVLGEFECTEFDINLLLNMLC
jgi:hypothetical protein